MPVVRLTISAVRVPALRVMVPEPLALMLMMPELLDTLAPMEIAALAALVARDIMPLLDVIAVGIFRAVLDVIEMLPVVLTMLPYVIVPTALMIRFLPLRVIVCPDDVTLPPLRSCNVEKVALEILIELSTVRPPA